MARHRFGNPELASHLTTGLWKWQHACDLFAGQVDERVKHLPQADFHSQLLARALTEVAPQPLGRLWYYPSAQLRSVAIVQSDDDWSTPEQFREIAQCLEARGGRATFFLVKDTKLAETMVAEMRGRGHTFAPHPDPSRCTDEWAFDFPRVLREETAEFQRRFGACSPTLQCHCAPWYGYMEWVTEFHRAGFRLLFAYLSGPAIYWHSYMCGSGRPIRFFDRTARRYDCWQQPVIIYDDASLVPLIRDRKDELIRRFDKFLDDVVRRSFTAVPFLSHPVSFATYSRPFMEACWDRVRQAGIPLWNGDEWLAFIEHRAAARIFTESSAGTITYRIEPLAVPLVLMIPMRSGATFRLNSKPVAVEIYRRLEQDYAFIPLECDGGAATVELQ